MLERLQGLPRGVDGLKAVGKISRDDYEKIAEPLFEEARREGRRIRFLYELGPEFEGLTPGAAWEDAKIGLRSMRLFDGCAIVTDVDWLRRSVRLAAFLMPCPVKIFGGGERDSAAAWLASLPQGPAVAHRLLAESGVIVVEVKEPLRAQDFEAIAMTADSWLEAHGDLQGLVIHAREFPGWQNLPGLLGHLRFIRDHHRKVRRVALSADTKLAVLGPRIAEHFIAAEVKVFEFSELDRAVEWAAGRTSAGAPAPARAP